MWEELAQMFVRGKKIKCNNTGEEYIVVYQMDSEKRLYFAVKNEGRLPCQIFLVQAAEDEKIV